MGNGRAKHPKQTGTSNAGHPPATPPGKITASIPEPITVRHQETSADNERYREEKDYRSEQIRQARKLNRITVAAAAAGIASVIGLIISLYFSRQALMIDQRAWVGPFETCAFSPTLRHYNVAEEGCPEIPSADTPNYARIYYRNTGKTPALNVHTAFKWVLTEDQIPEFDQFGDFGLDKSKEFTSPDPTPLRSIMTLQPGAHDNTGPLLSLEAQKVIKQVPLPGYIFGTIWYDDVFGNPHWTQFCAGIIGNFQAFYGCSKHNRTDSDPTSPFHPSP